MVFSQLPLIPTDTTASTIEVTTVAARGNTDIAPTLRTGTVRAGRSFNSKNITTYTEFV